MSRQRPGRKRNPQVSYLSIPKQKPPINNPTTEHLLQQATIAEEKSMRPQRTMPGQNPVHRQLISKKNPRQRQRLPRKRPTRQPGNQPQAPIRPKALPLPTPTSSVKRKHRPHPLPAVCSATTNKRPLPDRRCHAEMLRDPLQARFRSMPGYGLHHKLRNLQNVRIDNAER